MVSLNEMFNNNLYFYKAHPVSVCTNFFNESYYRFCISATSVIGMVLSSIPTVTIKAQ